jgi:hypothetical protein
MSNGKDVVKIPIRSLDEYKIRYNYDKNKHVGSPAPWPFPAPCFLSAPSLATTSPTSLSPSPWPTSAMSWQETAQIKSRVPEKAKGQAIRQARIIMKRKFIPCQPGFPDIIELDIGMDDIVPFLLLQIRQL